MRRRLPTRRLDRWLKRWTSRWPNSRLGRLPGRRAAGASALPGWPLTVHDTVRHFANPGPAFEPAATLARPDHTRARAIAFYLPQFHAFDQNDGWWGHGFTEWRNVARGMPRFAGHYQPRIPRDLGFYDATHAPTLIAQAALARAAGIDAFCFYYYWFDGQRLMDEPLDAFLRADVDQEFCLMWANENWTRRWDGRQDDVLIEQSYREEDESAFITDTARYLSHPRYSRVAGRPLFVLYRAAELPDARRTLQRWRRCWRDLLGVEPWIIIAQSYDDRDPRTFGADGAIEFPPHKVSRGIGDRRSEHRVLDDRFTGHLRHYRDMVARSLDEPPSDYPLIKTVSPHWDNDARREGAGVTFHGSTPANYERWLSGAVELAIARPFAEEPLLFINAWNEWAEGACLEPDVHLGSACLNATRRVLAAPASVPGPARARRVLLVGHDAHPNGAQMLLLELARCLKGVHGFDVTILLLGSGALLARYRSIATTHVIASPHDRLVPEFLAREAFPMALCNTAVTGALVPAIAATGARIVSLIHEMPTLLRERALERELHAIGAGADEVVFPARIVQSGFEQFVPRYAARATVRAQGLYRAPVPDAAARARERSALGIVEGCPLIINAGYADRRKGFDVFVEAARAWFDTGRDARFVWFGTRAPAMSAWWNERANDGLDERIEVRPFTDRMAHWYSAADAVLIGSREDPYPTVALEGLSCGLPVVAVAGCTGLDELLAEHGALAPSGCPGDIVGTLAAALRDDTGPARAARIERIARDYRFEDYAAQLLRLLDPASRPVSDVDVQG